MWSLWSVDFRVLRTPGLSGYLHARCVLWPWKIHKIMPGRWRENILRSWVELIDLTRFNSFQFYIDVFIKSSRLFRSFDVVWSHLVCALIVMAAHWISILSFCITIQYPLPVLCVTVLLRHVVQGGPVWWIRGDGCPRTRWKPWGGGESGWGGKLCTGSIPIPSVPLHQNRATRLLRGPSKNCKRHGRRAIWTIRAIRSTFTASTIVTFFESREWCWELWWCHN